MELGFKALNHLNRPFRWIEENDHEFWTYGYMSSMGMRVGINVTTGYLDVEENDHVSVWSLSKGVNLPQYVQGSVKKYFLSNANCARCSARTTEIILRPLLAESSKAKRLSYIVCSCGYPVWRISLDASCAAEIALSRAEYSRTIKKFRESLLKNTGGKHNKQEIQQILVLQKNRCIYCNVTFTESTRATRDHLMPLIYGGTDWALNIVMACHRCNSRRGTIPFRTYCKLLSPTQNRRILKHLSRRIVAVKSDQLQEGAFASFCKGLAQHKPQHPSYRSKLRYSAVIRRYASVNKLLPAAPHLILRRASVGSSH
jgi:hypothetical protein